MSYIIIIILILDQWIKNIINNNLYVSQSIPVINNIFHITYVKNTGAGFGIFSGLKNLLIIITIIIGIFLLIYRYKQDKNLVLDLAVGFILGGASGNFVDRIRWGYVIDYLDFRIWPVFNLADTSIVVGVGLLFIYLWKYEEALK
jgi:signal peptidase II